MSFVAAPFQLIAKHKRLLWRTTVSAAKERFAGSVGGVFWYVIGPIILMSIYASIYLLVFRVRPMDLSGLDYVLHMMAGLVPFLAFNESLSAGASSMFRDRGILLNTVFPAELLALRAVLVANVSGAVGLTIVVGVSFALGKVSYAALFVPVVLLLQIMFLAGIGWILGLVSLVVRDVQQILGFVGMGLMVMSPIAYTVDMVPRALKVLVYANPLAYFVLTYQSLILENSLPKRFILVVLISFTLVWFVVAYWIFQRVKRVFFDYA